MLEVDFTFAHSYEVEEVGEWPATGSFGIPVLYIPQPINRPEHEGLWLKLTPTSGTPWIGVFAFGYPSPPAFSRVVSTPDPNRVCVVSNGGGYIVDLKTPNRWEQAPTWPVLDVRSVPEHGLLVFADFIRLAAYGGSKWVWQTPRLCWDELTIRNIDSETVEGTGLNPFNPHMATRFAVELRTGRSLSPPPPGMPPLH